MKLQDSELLNPEENTVNFQAGLGENQFFLLSFKAELINVILLFLIVETCTLSLITFKAFGVLNKFPGPSLTHSFCSRYHYLWASLITQLVKTPPACRRPQFNSWVREIHWRRDGLPTSVFLGFPYGSAGKESARNVGYLGSIPGLGRSPGEGKGYPFQYSGLENSMNCIVYGVAKSWT